MKKESYFQSDLMDTLEEMFPGAIVTKLDPQYIQGIPDLLILFKKKWALLECKRSEHESHRPNQDYYVNKCNKWSFSAFIYPENQQQVLKELYKHFYN